MREYGKVHCTFWSSQTISTLSDDGRLLALYLITSPHSNIAGVFRLPDGYVAEDLRWSSERVSKGFRELLSNGFANRCGTTKWVWVVKHLEWNPPENPNQRKSAAKVAAQIPAECGWKREFMRVCGPLLGLEPEAEGNPSETVPQPFLNQEQEQEQEQKTMVAPADADSTVKPAAPLKAKDLQAQGIDPQHAADWLALRKAKRLPLTPTAWADTVAEGRKAGLSPPQTVAKAVANNWAGFKASWLANGPGGRPQPPGPSASDPFAGCQ